jgi:glutaredoxin
MTAVEIFGSGNCPNCTKAMQMAKDYNLEYEYFDITYKQYRDILEERVELVDGMQQPVIFWHKRFIGNFIDFATEIEDTIGGYGEQRF